jgi:hypothetical protein
VLTFFDFGPPFNYYDLYLVSETANGASIERISLTPPGHACLMPAKIETASGSLNESVAALLAPRNPCTIPEKELHPKTKRHGKWRDPSGSVVVMQIQCGDEVRLIHSNIPESVMLGLSAGAQDNVAWIMQLTARLAQALGPGVMDKPMVTIPDDNQPSTIDYNSPILRDLGAGKYDALFQYFADKPSDLYREAHYPLPAPTVRLLTSAPVSPETFAPPEYPSLARAASVEGEVSFKIDIDPDGGAKNLVFVSGPPLLRGAVNNAVASWKFPESEAGQQVQATIEFKLNCPAHDN